MAKNGAEGTAAMGIDAPLAVLSDMHQNLFGYFKQRFAQVTNPPIDAIREKVVTSTTVYIGEDGNLLEEKAENCKMLKVNNPILTETDLLKIKNMKEDGFKVAEIPTIYYKNSSLEKAIDYLFIEVDRAIREGAKIEEWMNIMWQCRHFWYFPDCSSIWYVRRNVRLWGLFWRRENQEKYIILRH